MYHKEKSIQIKNSASALYNNLGVLRIAPRRLTYFTVVHANVVNMVSASWDGLNYCHRQLQSKEPNVATSTSLIMQAAFCVLPSRELLVVTSQKGIQMYESDGSIMVYWHALDAPETPTAQAVFARGIAAVRENYICVGVSSGAILVFDVPSKGSNITLSEVLEEHRGSITDLASECSGSQECLVDVVSADDGGNLCVWKSGEEFQLLNKIHGFDMTCSSVKLWKGTLVVGYGTGQIRVYEAVTGILHAEINAHARWIYSLDIAPVSGLLLSAAEDSMVRVWHLTVSPETNNVEVAHLHNECVTDTQICGAKFCDGDGYAFAVTGYDLSEIICYTQL
ncbi:WD repeat-containing protein 54 [Thalassophryne amazonica]|uniref:WD repeat-containing protein 54 n=1 Tax=Thalassophryne amazonica TaxID=390379 RepID=UPI001471E8A1|nr:WD repeat-containing protein 54 [Thalassophryne amazonica]XP_034025961.1 WD repeat-containing protein 54 [Thalassophryne amazonica]